MAAYDEEFHVITESYYYCWDLIITISMTLEKVESEKISMISETSILFAPLYVHAELYFFQSAGYSTSMTEHLERIAKG